MQLITFFRSLRRDNITLIIGLIMKLLLSVFLLLFTIFANTAHSQSIQIEIDNQHANLEPGVFKTDSGLMSKQGNTVVIEGNRNYFSYNNPASASFSGNFKKAGLITFGEVPKRITVGHDGNQLSESESEFLDPGDDSIHVLQFDDGRSIVRDNIANFTLYDAAGKQVMTISNSSQSPDGERVSGIKSDPGGRSVVLYNPEIRMGEIKRSRASLINRKNQDLNTFYEAEGRTIDDVIISENGSYILLITKSGTNHFVTVYDRFGNEIFDLEAEFELRGATITGDGNYLTIYSGGRAQVYNTLSSERLGSASLRGNLVFASYQPEDDTIILLGGEESGMNISNPEVSAVNIGLRQIARGEANAEVTKAGYNLSVNRTAPNQYTVIGFNKNLLLTTNF